MNNGKRKFIQIALCVFLWAISVISIVLWAFLLHTVIQSCWYKYPVVNNWFSLGVCICSVLLPVLFIISSFVALVCGNLKKSCISIVLLVPVYILSFMVSAAACVGAPAICSYSSDPDNFGVYDTRLDEIWRANPPECYPDTIPEDAQNVKYCYYYQNASAEIVHIAVGWQADIQEIRSLTFQIEQGEMKSLENNQVMVTFTDSYFKNALFIDDEDNYICYMIASPWMTLPCSIDEVFDILSTR